MDNYSDILAVLFVFGPFLSLLLLATGGLLGLFLGIVVVTFIVCMFALFL